MSYILDALKKSESERGHGNIPGVQTVHSSSINYHQQRKAFWPYFLIAAILLNILVIAYFIYTQNDSTQTAPTAVEHNKVVSSDETQFYSPPIANARLVNPAPVSTTTNHLAPQQKLTASVSTTDKQLVIEKNNIKATPLIQQEVVAVETKPEPVPEQQQIMPATTSSDEKIIEQHELPEHIQRELPSLIISAHVYSSTPEQRSLIVNNEFFEENDYIMDNIILHEITKDGAIFNYNGILFHNRSVSGWQ